MRDLLSLTHLHTHITYLSNRSVIPDLVTASLPAVGSLFSLYQTSSHYLTFQLDHVIIILAFLSILSPPAQLIEAQRIKFHGPHLDRY